MHTTHSRNTDAQTGAQDYLAGEMGNHLNAGLQQTLASKSLQLCHTTPRASLSLLQNTCPAPLPTRSSTITPRLFQSYLLVFDYVHQVYAGTTG